MARYHGETLLSLVPVTRVACCIICARVLLAVLPSLLELAFQCSQEPVEDSQGEEEKDGEDVGCRC